MRDRSIDVAKGLAIVAIVLGHVIRGLGRAGLWDPNSTDYILWDRALYLFHLSTFALLAGLFVASGVRKRGAGGYLRERTATFLYLYVLWTILQEGMLKGVLASLVNNPVSWGEVFALWRPQGQFWYLPFMIVGTALLVLTRPWESRLRAGLTLAGAAALSVTFWGIPGDYFGLQGYGIIVFLVIGALPAVKAWCLPGAGLREGRRTTLGLVALAVTVALFAFTPTMPATTAGGLERNPLSIACGVVATVTAVLSVLALSRSVARLPGIGAVLAHLGKHSLEIFLAHILATAGARIVLEKLGVREHGPQLLGGLIAGLAFPVLLVAAGRFLPLGWLWAAPRWLTGAPRAAAPTKADASDAVPEPIVRKLAVPPRDAERLSAPASQATLPPARGDALDDPHAELDVTAYWGTPLWLDDDRQTPRFRAAAQARTARRAASEAQHRSPTPRRPTP